MSKNFPVVCIEGYSDLTIGKIYNVISVKINFDWDLVADDYLIVNDLDIKCHVCANNFIPLDQWREQQLNKLIK